MRSATAPETIVAAVAAKENWKTHMARSSVVAPIIRKRDVPTNAEMPLPSPPPKASA